MATIKAEVGAIVTVADTELNALANGAFATGKEYDNSVQLYLYSDFELFIDNSANPTANSQVDLWFIPAIDGTNYASTAGPPPNLYIGSFVMQTTQDIRYCLYNIRLPPCKFKPYVRNNSGVAFAATGSTLKMIPSRYQSV